MRGKILKFYFYILSIVIVSTISFHVFFLIKLDKFYTDSLEDLNQIKLLYYQINNFENAYIKKQNKEILAYLDTSYKLIENSIDSFEKKLNDRNLLFLLGEIKEITYKHKESFTRATFYLKDLSDDESFYEIEAYNLQKSIELFINQNNIFNKKIEKFTQNLNEFIKEKKSKEKKQLLHL